MPEEDQTSCEVLDSRAVDLLGVFPQEFPPGKIVQIIHVIFLRRHAIKRADKCPRLSWQVEKSLIPSTPLDATFFMIPRVFFEQRPWNLPFPVLISALVYLCQLGNNDTGPPRTEETPDHRRQGGGRRGREDTGGHRHR